MTLRRKGEIEALAGGLEGDADKVQMSKAGIGGASVRNVMWLGLVLIITSSLTYDTPVLVFINQISTTPLQSTCAAQSSARYELLLSVQPTIDHYSLEFNKCT